MLANIIGFNLSWFGLVIYGKQFIPFTFVWLIYHFYQCSNRQAELKVISFVVATGVIADSKLISLGVFNFPEQSQLPFWLICLWASFAATVSHSLAFLAKSKPLQFAVGFVFPAFSYLAGASFDAVELPLGPYVTYFILAPLWSVLMVLFYQFHQYVNFPRGEDENITN